MTWIDAKKHPFPTQYGDYIVILIIPTSHNWSTSFPYTVSCSIGNYDKEYGWLIHRYSRRDHAQAFFTEKQLLKYMPCSDVPLLLDYLKPNLEIDLEFKEIAKETQELADVSNKEWRDSVMKSSKKWKEDLYNSLQESMNNNSH